MDMDLSDDAETFLNAIESVFADNNGEEILDSTWIAAVDAVFSNNFSPHLVSYTKKKDGVEYVNADRWTFDEGTKGRFDKINSSVGIILDFNWRERYTDFPAETAYDLESVRVYLIGGNRELTSNYIELNNLSSIVQDGGQAWMVGTMFITYSVNNNPHMNDFQLANGFNWSELVTINGIDYFPVKLLIIKGGVTYEKTINVPIEYVSAKMLMRFRDGNSSGDYSAWDATTLEWPATPASIDFESYPIGSELSRKWEVFNNSTEVYDTFATDQNPQNVDMSNESWFTSPEGFKTFLLKLTVTYATETLTCYRKLTITPAP